MQQIADWLEALGLGQYAQRFAENDISFGILPHLTDQDLKELGVASLGHRRQLLSAIADLSGVQKGAAQPASTTEATIAPRDTRRAPSGHGDVLGPRWFDRTLCSHGPGRPARTHLGLS